MKLDATVRRPGGTLLLGIELPEIPQVVNAAGRTWAAKEEFHVTLIGNEGLRWLVGEAGIADLAAIERAITRSLEGLTFRVTLRDELWQLREGDARTIIRMADVDGAEEFFLRLEEELDLHIDRPPYHVTLYCLGTEKGIGVRSDTHLRTIGERLSATELLDRIR